MSGNSYWLLPGVVMLICVSAPAAFGREGEAGSMSVQLNEPVIVAQSEEAKHPWGVWQFPGITRIRPGLLAVMFSRTIDSGALDAEKHQPAGRRISSDGGKTWKLPKTPLRFFGSRNSCTLSNGDVVCLQAPPAADIAKDRLPAPLGSCRHGYGGFYTVRDPLKMPDGMGRWHLMRRPAGSDQWERRPAAVDDPDGGIPSYDSPDRPHAVMHWTWLMQVLELPDGSLLNVQYGFRLGPDRKPHPKWESWCCRSTDGGLTWKFQGVIARDDEQFLVGFTEPVLTVLPDGSLLAVLRTECAKSGPMYSTQSRDGGKTWDEPQSFHPFGVLPQLLTLGDGVTVLCFGRPGTHLLFSCDGQGRTWKNLTTLVAESYSGTGIDPADHGYQIGKEARGKRKQTRTSGYPGLLATGPDTFLVIYDQFDLPNAQGQPRKTILVRRVTVTRN